VAMMAMIKIVNSEKLKRLGWKLLLQVRNHVIMRLNLVPIFLYQGDISLADPR
jgi:hypothetical protein